MAQHGILRKKRYGEVSRCIPNHILPFFQCIQTFIVCRTQPDRLASRTGVLMMFPFFFFKLTNLTLPAPAFYEYAVKNLTTHPVVKNALH